MAIPEQKRHSEITTDFTDEHGLKKSFIRAIREILPSSVELSLAPFGSGPKSSAAQARGESAGSPSLALLKFVFAVIARAFSGQQPESRSHLCRALAEGSAGLAAEDGEECIRGNDGLELTAFLRRDEALGITLG
jgi:hypothetical protein